MTCGRLISVVHRGTPAQDNTPAEAGVGPLSALIHELMPFCILKAIPQERCSIRRARTCGTKVGVCQGSDGTNALSSYPPQDVVKRGRFG